MTLINYLSDVTRFLYNPGLGINLVWLFGTWETG